MSSETLKNRELNIRCTTVKTAIPFKASNALLSRTTPYVNTLADTQFTHLYFSRYHYSSLPFPLLHTHFSPCFVYSVAIFHYFKHNIRYIQSKTIVQFTSASTMDGLPASARAIATLCCWPPES